MFLRSVPGGWINLTLNIIRFLAGCLRNDLNSDKKTQREVWWEMGLGGGEGQY